jgi:type I restriction enzyme R subunit
VNVFLEKMAVLHGLLHGCNYHDFRKRAYQLLPAVANHILGQEDGKKRFADAVLAATQAFSLCCTLDEALKYRDELAFLQAVKAALTKHGSEDKKLSDEQKEHALRQILSQAVVSTEVVDIFQAAGLDKPNIGIVDGKVLDEVRQMKERNLAVELLERLLKDGIQSHFRTNVVKMAKYSELLKESLRRYRNRAIQTAQIIEELLAMAKQFRDDALKGAELGLSPEERAFYDALAANEAAVRELGDATLKKMAAELVDKLSKSVTVDWAVRETVRARLRVMVKTLLRRYKYPPDKQAQATETVLRQAEELSAEWVAA